MLRFCSCYQTWRERPFQERSGECWRKHPRNCRHTVTHLLYNLVYTVESGNFGPVFFAFKLIQ